MLSLIVISLCVLAVMSEQSAMNELLAKYGIKVKKTCILRKIDSDVYRDVLKCKTNEILLPTDAAVKDYCESNQDICPRLILDKLDMCLNRHQKEYLQHVTRKVTAIQEKLCENNGQKLLGMNNMDYSSCPHTELNNKFADCSNIALSLASIKFEDYYKEQSCRLQYSLEKCRVQAFDLCEDKRGYEMYAHSLCVGMRATPCVKYVKECTSSTVDIPVVVPDKVPEFTIIPTSKDQDLVINLKLGNSSYLGRKLTVNFV